MLEQAPALLRRRRPLVADRPADVVDHPEARPGDDRRVGHVVGAPFGELLALPHAVQPVRVPAVAASDVDRNSQFGFDVESQWVADLIGGVDRRAGGNPCPGTVVDLHPRPAQLFDPAVTPDPGAVVDCPEPAGLLLDDDDDGEVVERHRHIQPPHALERRVRRPARGLGGADGPDAPGPVPGADPGGRVDGDLFAVDHQMPAPGTQLGESLRVQGDLGTRPHHVALLLHHTEESVPGQIAGDALGLVENDAQLLQRRGDLDAVAVDVLVQAIGVDGVGQVHRGLVIPSSDEQEGVLDPQVGVIADAGDDEDVAGAVVGVEVRPVIEVAVGGAGPGDRLGDLVDGEFVKRSKHSQASPSSATRRRNTPPW